MSIAPEVAIADFNRRAAAFLDIHRQRPTQPFIANVRTEVDALDVGGVLFPVTVNDAEPDNAWVCSPLTTYATYAAEEIARLGHPRLTAPLQWIAAGMGGWLARARIDRAVAINNWLVSTNAYPSLRELALDQVVDAALARWPTHALWFRSLNTAHHGDWLDALARRGFTLVPSRQVYLFSDVAALAHRHADFKRDLALLRRASREGTLCSRFVDEDFRRIAELYAQLYLDKYSGLNPRYHWTLIKAWSMAGLLQLKGIRDEQGMLQGAVGIFPFGNLLTSPIVGYNTGLPVRIGLYRMLAATVLQQAIDDDCLVNLSAGVAHFKRQRGGQPAIEYSAVLTRHLPGHTQRAVRALGAVTRHVGVPIMQRCKL
ncbi:BioF2-like acetyltransferase domain-containing protein [Rhodanobacter sp. Root179]|uniref:hypothetical protein n=1 Tax=Rhodanobacter sp. Root179 TaxID=1736482 RepID=UPI0006F51DED|nr:hypothetical protein [Rhodanobacter sp. Root179]KRB39525.1 hypothetical protein ASD82_10980 [Rhodanobacter sp. Root179]